MTTNSVTERGVHLLTRIGMQTDRLRELEHLIEVDVNLARQNGCSWRLIGVSLGTTTQAAWEKYRPVPAYPPLLGQASLFLETADHEQVSPDDSEE